MTNLFLREPTYITVTEIKDSTSNSDLQNLSDDEIKILISKAEDTIDNYIWSYWVPFEEDQTLIFPIDLEWIALMPQDVKIATFYTVEQLFANWDMIESAKTKGWDIIEEKVWDRTVKYSEWWLNDNAAVQLWLPLQAIYLLKNYKQIFYRNKL